MVPGPGSDLQEEAVLDGGPLDGKRQTVDGDTDHLCVVLTDGQQQQALVKNRLD
jgi:hypothetical protein